MSDRIIKTYEISEPNSSTMLGPSDQKSKITSGGPCAALYQAQNGHFRHFGAFSPKKKAKISSFWRFFWQFWRDNLRHGLKLWTQHWWDLWLPNATLGTRQYRHLSSVGDFQDIWTVYMGVWVVLSPRDTISKQTLITTKKAPPPMQLQNMQWAYCL